MPNEKRCLICEKKIKAEPVEFCGKYSIYCCPYCGLQFADPLDYNPGIYDEAYKGLDTPDSIKAGRYSSLMDSSSNRIILTSYEHLIMKWLKDNLPASAYVLDLGCGTGKFLAALQKEGFFPLGMDVATEPIKMLKDKGYQVTVGSIKDYPPDWPTPDAIILLEVLEHLPNPLEFLENLKACFPRAPLLLSVPSPYRWNLKMGREKGDYPPNHLTRWTKKALSLALEKAGYKAKVILPKVTPEELWGTGLGRIMLRLANLRRSRNTSRQSNEQKEFSPLTQVLLRRIKKFIFYPYAAYLNLRGYTSRSMVAIGVPKGGNI